MLKQRLKYLCKLLVTHQLILVDQHPAKQILLLAPNLTQVHGQNSFVQLQHRVGEHAYGQINEP